MVWFAYKTFELAEIDVLRKATTSSTTMAYDRLLYP
jgi:hypothetical protein